MLYNPLESIGTLIQRFLRQRNDWNDMLPESKDLGMLRVDVLNIKEKLVPSPQQ
jgi:hypothetical protein